VSWRCGSLPSTSDRLASWQGTLCTPRADPSTG